MKFGGIGVQWMWSELDSLDYINKSKDMYANKNLLSMSLCTVFLVHLN